MTDSIFVGSDEKAEEDKKKNVHNRENIMFLDLELTDFGNHST